MNENVKKDWLKALRSGDFVQGKSVLQGDGKFCCLGVLCQIAEEAGVVEGRNIPSINADYEIMRAYPDPGEFNDLQSQVLPRAVMNWAELGDVSPSVQPEDDGRTYSLAELNDTGTSFDQIADLIEDNF